MNFLLQFSVLTCHCDLKQQIRPWMKCRPGIFLKLKKCLIQSLDSRLDSMISGVLFNIDYDRLSLFYLCINN